MRWLFVSTHCPGPSSCHPGWLCCRQNLSFLRPTKPNKNRRSQFVWRKWKGGFNPQWEEAENTVGASRTAPHFHEESGDCIEEGAQSGVGAKEQRREDPVFFLFLLHCFKNSHRLASGSPGAGSFVFRVLYCDLLPVMQKETSKRWSAKAC